MDETENKSPTKTALAKARHAEFKSTILAYWQFKNPDTEMPWGVAGGRALEFWLRAHPDTSIDQFRQYLRNRARSEVAPGEHPSRWIGSISLNRYMEPLRRARGTSVSLGAVRVPADRASGRSEGIK